MPTTWRVRVLSSTVSTERMQTLKQGHDLADVFP